MRVRIGLLFVCFSALLCAQASFEVATIKLHPDPIAFTAYPSVRGATLTAVATSLYDMITSAYGIRYDQISGGPLWAQTDNWDVVGKAGGDGPLTMGRALPMLQALLAERFRLRVRRE